MDLNHLHTHRETLVNAPKEITNNCAERIILGGSWVVISRVIGRITRVITHIRGLITQLRTAHEPPSK